MWVVLVCVGLVVVLPTVGFAVWLCFLCGFVILFDCGLEYGYGLAGLDVCYYWCVW